MVECSGVLRRTNKLLTRRRGFECTFMFERQSRERGDFNRGHVANHISLGICGSACYSEDPRLETTCTYMCFRYTVRLF